MIHQKLGSRVTTPNIREQWITLIRQIESLVQPGELLEDYFFHGTANGALTSIINSNIIPSDIYSQQQNIYIKKPVTYWGTLPIAVEYAEDSYSNRFQKVDEIGLIAISKENLLSCGELLPDEASLEFPLYEILDIDPKELDSELETVWQNEITWETSLRLVKSVACPNDIPREFLHPLKNISDLENLLHDIKHKSLTL